MGKTKGSVPRGDLTKIFMKPNLFFCAALTDHNDGTAYI